MTVIVFVVAIWNASIGPSGALTFVTMATLLPPAAVVPIHAAVEGISGLSRIMLLREYIKWRFVTSFCLFGVIGFVIGAPILNLTFLTDNALRIILGTAIIVTAWFPIERLFSAATPWIAGGGIVTAFMTLFIGATSPLVSALVQRFHIDHRTMLATSSACMVFQHTGKILIFGFLGFSFALYAGLVVTLIAASIAGSWIGRELLIRVNQKLMRQIFKTVVTLLGINLLWTGMS